MCFVLSSAVREDCTVARVAALDLAFSTWTAFAAGYA